MKLKVISKKEMDEMIKEDEREMIRRGLNYKNYPDTKYNGYNLHIKKRYD
jgi:hypothetical protein